MPPLRGCVFFIIKVSPVVTIFQRARPSYGAENKRDDRRIVDKQEVLHAIFILILYFGFR